MKLKTLLTTCIAMMLATSCIKEEGPDREADILEISIDDPRYLRTIISEQTNEISFTMAGDISDLENGFIAPKIEVSPNATVEPASLEAAQLTNYKRFYTVTAEDGAQKVYLLSVDHYKPLLQDFEEWDEVTTGNHKYEIPKDRMWTNANEGVDILYRPNTPFPTRYTTEDIYPESEGSKALVLETVKGNESSYDIMNIPVYAGNMFRGVFDVTDALSDPLSTTLFGQPHPEFLGKALALVAYYKYRSGDTYMTYEKVNGKKIIEKIENRQRLDKPDIYAVLFKVEKGSDEKGFLTAHDIKTSDKIVATAFMADRGEKEEWEKLVTKFTYKEELDFDKYDYKLTVVLTSSEDGGLYQGAIGSKLIVDDLRVVCSVDEDADLYK